MQRAGFWQHTSRRSFLAGAAGAAGLALWPGLAATTLADPHEQNAQWLANHEATRLVDAAGQPVVFLPQWTRLRLLRALRGGLVEVWAPRFGLVGRVAATAVGPVQSPSPEQLATERATPAGPPLMGGIGLPGRVLGGANLRLWPAARPDTLLRTLPHNAPLWALNSVEGDDGEEWYSVNWLDQATLDASAQGYIHHSLVRLPRLPYANASPDRADDQPKHFEADLQEPAMLVAFEHGTPIWSTLTLKGTIAHRTPLGPHEIVRRVPDETMTSERVYPPIPRDAPGGYYVKHVLWTQYFTLDGASIHYNYWSSNWGYAGSHGCLGVGYHEAKWAWTWAGVGTPVRVFA